MRFMLIDDDAAIRSMLQDVIEDYDLGEVIDSFDNTQQLNAELLHLHAIDILIIDMLMPEQDGVQAVKIIKPAFNGKVIMLSQVENKELIGNAYQLGVDYYITKPLNRIEIVSVIRMVSEHLRLKKLVYNIEDNLHTALQPAGSRTEKAPVSVRNRGQAILDTLGISADAGYHDLLDILEELSHRPEKSMDAPCLKLKDLFLKLAQNRQNENPQKAAKAIEQRLRRTIYQALINLASIGVVDYANPKFEDYASRYFDFSEIRRVMQSLENEEKPPMSSVHINLKKFLHTLVSDAKKIE